ncbi:unnamed protein product [Zymoseptoria tritici ST99CH_1A5]|uniref:Required for respiratory growth protein 9, mitochondrial n=2 Tax=Zymoseptoria tritici TaxID=1047171 RepID=A0A1Y6L7K6_ZYMTR|nr:unnamed protein product [Zymoseptoria tritici ST99CH_1A5]
MDRRPFDRPPEHPLGHHESVPPPSNHPSSYPPPTAQPPIQIPFSDPFQTSRDPFYPGGRRDSIGLSSRAWQPSAQGPSSQHHHHHRQSSLDQSLQHPQGFPPPPPNGLAMSAPHDHSRHPSMGHAGSPPQYPGGSSEQQYPPPPSFPARNMPPPSPPQNAPAAGHHMGTAPRGPSTTSPFARPRDLSSHRPGMSISAILGGGEDPRPSGSPHSSAAAPASAFGSMQPPSPGRARASSMREGHGREPRRDGLFASPQFRREPQQHSFRAFQPPPQQESAHHANGNGAPVRPNSQPVDSAGFRHMHEMAHREEGRANMFRNYGEPPAPPRNDAMYRNDRPPVQNGVTSHPQDSRPVFNSPPADRENLAQRDYAPGRYQPGGFSTHMREEPSSLFRPGYPPTSQPTAEQARESIEDRAADMRRQLSRQSPPPPEYGPHERGRNGFAERPMTLEEHQRMEMMHREQQHRKESDGSVHRAVLNLSPELNRRGRNSPLPQAVQGAQPRHLGPGGNNPGIKTEFGRMFSGLGSGAGSSTPGPGHPMNGHATPSRGSPARLVDSSEMSRGAPIEMDDNKGTTKTGSRGGKRNGRRAREEVDSGRNTPDARGNKRSKTTHTAHHHHHHVHPHHHHHHHAAEGTPPSFTISRAPSNPLSQANLAASQAHHHHHHHHHHAQAVGHHHHHAPRAQPPPRMPSTTVVSKKVLEACAGKPRRHLGSQLYTTEVSLAPAAETPLDAKIKFSSKSKPIPVFEGKENSTFTVRVPRYFLAPSEAGNSSLEEICKRRQLWGTEVYTDDSDVVAAAIHSGWLKGDFGDLNHDLQQASENGPEQDTSDATLLTLTERPSKPVQVPEGFDAHITVLVLPPLEKYAATSQHHIWSRDWAKTHDGMSFMIHSIEFVDEGASSRFAERGAAARKNRIAIEQASREEAAAGLLMFANGGGGNGSVRIMHRCSCTTKALEAFWNDFAGISIRQRPAQQFARHRRIFGTRPAVRQLSSVTVAGPDDAFVPFDLQLSGGQSGTGIHTDTRPRSQPDKVVEESSLESGEKTDEDGKAEWHAEIVLAEPMVQAERSGSHGKMASTGSTRTEESSNAGATEERSRAETRMLRKLKRVKDGSHNQSKPGKLQDQVESVLKMVEGPMGSEVLKSLVETSKKETEASVAARAKKATTARDPRTKRTTVKRQPQRSGMLVQRQRKVEEKVGTGETKAGEAGEEQGVEAKKSRRERRKELNTKASSSRQSPAAKPARELRSRRKELETKPKKRDNTKEAIASEDADDTPRPKQEPWGIQKSALERKFGETGWQPRKRLSPDTLEGIRALHASNPSTYNIDMLREHFQISPEAIRRVLKSKWKPNAEEIEKRMKRWEKRGVKKWSEMAAQGQKPPKKWREMGVPNPNLQKRVAWEGEVVEKSQEKVPIHEKATRLARGLKNRERAETPSLAGRIL